jgi:hypothetical protein
MRPATRCDDFLASADPSLAYRVPHDNFPVVTDPVFVKAAAADFMRPDDWVIGLRVGNVARCYPAWMLDNSHVVNDTIEGEYYAVMHCEICCSNATFIARHDGRRLTFGTGGLFGGTLALFDEQTRSLWSHGMGVAFDGPLAGTGLVRVESFQATYAEWLALQPGTGVMVWPAPAMHPDARHGHGTDAIFAQAGIERLVLRTMAVQEDARLPENEIVISVFTPGGHAALPLQTLVRAGGLLRFSVGGYDLVALSAGVDSTLCGVFHPRLVDVPESGVRLTTENGRFVDTKTGSEFRVDGLAVAGPLEGRRLLPLPAMMNKWHSLTCFIPGIAIVEADGPPVSVDEAQLAPVFDRLRAAGYRLETTRRLYALEIPHEARCGFAVDIDGAPFHALLFSHDSIAADELLWRPHAAEAGAVLLVSMPERYRDWTNTRAIPDDEIAWSPLPGDAGFQRALRDAAGLVETDERVEWPGLTEFVSALSGSGFECKVDRSCYRDTLPVGAIAGVRVEIAGDPFLIHRFKCDADAAEADPAPRHGLRAGHFVLRSDPPDIYESLERATLCRRDEDIGWSRLLASEVFVTAVRAAARVA